MKPILLLSIMLALAGCGEKKKADAASKSPVSPIKQPNGRVVLPPDSPQLNQIKVETVVSAEVPVAEVDAPGKIEANPNKVAHVVLPVAGKITKVLVKTGDSVRQGQPLLAMVSPDIDAAMSAYLQANAGVTTAKAVLTKAQTDLERSRDLFEHNAMAKREVLNNEAMVAQSQAALQQASTMREQTSRRVELLGLKPGEFGQELMVHAPIAGKVLEMTVVPGEYRNDTNAGLITIADLSSIWVSSDVPETSIRLIQRGEHLDVELAAYPGDHFKARVTRIADTVDPTTRTLKVSAELPNPGERLRPEMYGRIRHVDATASRPVVPAAAVVQGDGQNMVYREVSRGVFQPAPVTLGGRVGDRVAILQGLHAGDRIVTDGVMLLKAY